MEATGSESAQQAASATPSTGTPAPWAWLAVLASATLLALSLWISADAVVPTLARLWHISGATAMWLTASVQLSFVTGALVNATLGLPDRLNSRRLMVGCCVAGALCNGLFVLLGRNIALGLTLRWLTGVAIAGAYPTTLKMVTPPPRAMAARRGGRQRSYGEPECGSKRQRRTDRTDQTLLMLVNHRCRHELPTVLATTVALTDVHRVAAAERGPEHGAYHGAYHSGAGSPAYEPSITDGCPE